MSIRRIVVLKTWTIKEGEKNGKPWKLTGVEATAADGSPISEPLKTFGSLPRGEVEVEIEVQHSEQYGTSYLLKPTGGRSSNGGGTGEVAELRGRIERLESEVNRLASLVDRREPDSGPAPVAAGIPDDDIPF